MSKPNHGDIISNSESDLASKQRNKAAVVKKGTTYIQKLGLFEGLIKQFQFDLPTARLNDSQLDNIRKTFNDVLSHECTWRGLTNWFTK